MNSKQKKTLFKWVQLFMSCALIYWVFAHFPQDFKSLSLAACHWNWVALAFLVQFIIVVMMVYRWKSVMLISADKKPSFKEFLYYLMVGYFFSSFLPFSFGGDMIRSYAFAQKTGDLADSASSTLLSRLLGILVLFLVFWGALLVGGVALPTSLVVGMSVLGLGYIVALAFLIEGSWYKFCEKFIPPKVIQIFLPLSTFKKHLGALSGGIFWSVGIQLLVIFMTFMLYRSVGSQVQIVDLYICMPLIIFMVFLPISISGIGVREVGSIWLLGQFAHVPEVEILQVSLLSYIITYSLAMLGGLWMLWRRYLVSADQSEELKEQKVQGDK